MATKKKILYIVEAMGGGVFTYIVDLANELVDTYDMYIAYAVRKQTPSNYKEYGHVYKNLSMRGHSEIFLYQTDCPQSSSHQIALLWGQFYALRGMGGALSSVRPRI